MTPIAPRTVRRALAPACAALLAVVLAGCSGSAGGAGAAGSRSASTGATTSAVDPHSLRGPATAMLADHDVHPVGRPGPATLPVTVRSFDGPQVTVTDTRRILALDLYGTLAETVFGLGLGGQVIGRDVATGFPSAAKLPVVTQGGQGLSAEAVLELNPSVVLTDSTLAQGDVVQQLRQAGVAVVLFDPARTLTGIGPQIRAVAGTLGVPAAGERLATDVRQRLDAARGAVPASSKPLRIAFLYLRGSSIVMLGGTGSGADAMIEAIGARDVGTELGIDRPFLPLTSEALIGAAPDVILLMTKGLSSVNGVKGLLKIPGIAQTPAGQHQRVIDMEDTALLTLGTRTPQTVQALTRAVYGQP